MEALNAAGSLTPLSVLSDNNNKRTIKPRKLRRLPIVSHLKKPKIEASSSRNVGIVLLNCLLGSGGIASALTYEEALEESVSGVSASDLDLTGITTFIVGNPVISSLGVAILVFPLILSQVLGKPKKPWGVGTAKAAYAKLGEDQGAQLLDIRPSVEVRKVGGPDVRGLRKKAVNVVYNGEDKVGFLKKLAVKFKEPESTTLFILDKFDGNSELVAELVTANGFKAAYAIKDGAEGSRGWTKSGLPWIAPKSFSLDFSGLTDAFGEGSEALPFALGIAAGAAGLGLLAFTEVETILQVLGSAALVQLISNKFLFAEDRKKTLQQVDEFLTTQIAPKEIVDDVKQIGKALLPFQITSKSLPAPVTEEPEVVKDEPEPVQPAPEINSVKDEPEPVQTAPEINSVPKPEVVKAADSLPPSPTPLSPYPNYPDLKPPSSPMPSKPILGTNPVPEASESLPPISSTLSPFSNYPDLKPPSSPMPSQP